MNEILDLIKELESCSTEEYEKVKPVILAQSEDNERLHRLMQDVFRFIESRRLKLIGAENVA